MTDITNLKCHIEYRGDDPDDPNGETWESYAPARVWPDVGGAWWSGFPGVMETTKEVAERVRDCVNAMAGIANPAAVRAVFDYVGTLKSDELPLRVMNRFIELYEKCKAAPFPDIDDDDEEEDEQPEPPKRPAKVLNAKGVAG